MVLPLLQQPHQACTSTWSVTLQPHQACTSTWSWLDADEVSRGPYWIPLRAETCRFTRARRRRRRRRRWWWWRMLALNCAVVLMSCANGRYPKKSHPTRYTLHRTRYTLHRTRYTLHRTRYTLHRTRYTLHRTRYTVHRTRYTLHPEQSHPELVEIAIAPHDARDRRRFSQDCN
jgi:hypothetical protein